MIKDFVKRRPLLTILLVAFLVYMAIAVIYQLYAYTFTDGFTFSTDECYYSAMSWYQALLLRMKDVTQLSDEMVSVLDPLGVINFVEYIEVNQNKGLPIAQGYLYSVVLGYIYAVVGYVPMVARIFNITLGLAAALCVYSIAKSVFGEKIALLTLVLYLISPIYIYLSISITEDMMRILCLTGAIAMFLKIKGIKSFFLYSIPMGVAFWGLYQLLEAVFFLLMIVLGISVFVKAIDLNRRKILSIALIACSVIALLTPKGLDFIEHHMIMLYGSLLSKHMAIGQLAGATTYRLYPDKFYIPYDYACRDERAFQAVKSMHGISEDRKMALPYPDIRRMRVEIFFIETRKYVPATFCKGLLYILFAPFPWHVKKLTQALGAVHMTYWYALFPFMCIAIWNSFKRITKKKLVLLLLIFTFIPALALTEGNMGGLIRHREFIAYACVIFASCGIVDASPFLRKAWARIKR